MAALTSGDFGGKAKIVDDQARREIIATVDDDVDVVQDIDRCSAVDTLPDWVKCDFRV